VLKVSDFKCPFCGSDKLYVEQGGNMVKKKNPVWGEDLYEVEKRLCCKFQARNKAHIDAKYSKTLGRTPTLEEVWKL